MSELSSLPLSLPGDSRSRIEVAISKAEIEFLCDDESQFSEDLRGSYNSLERKEIRAWYYLETIFEAVFMETIATVNLSAAELRKELYAFRSQLSDEVFRSKWPASQDGEHDRQYFDEEIRWRARESSVWSRLQGYLLELAEWELSPEAQTGGASIPKLVPEFAGPFPELAGPFKPRTEIDIQIKEKCNGASRILGRRVTLKDFWSICRYNKRDCERSRNPEDPRVAPGATKAVKSVLSMSLEDFAKALQAKKAV